MLVEWLLFVGCWLVVGFPRMVFRELFSEKRSVSPCVWCMCDRRLLSLFKLLILISRPSPSLAAVDINGVYYGVITRAAE